MKIYIAGRYSDRVKLLEIAKKIEAQGGKIFATPIWLTGQNDDTCPIECAANDMDDLFASNLLLFFSESVGRNGGSLVELGMALAKGIPVVVVGRYTNVFTRLCRRVDSVDELLSERTPERM